MRPLLSLVAVVGCGSPALPGPPPSSALVQNTAPAAPKLPELAPLAASSPSCGGLEQLARAPIDVVQGRLRVSAPKGAADTPRAYDLMSAPASPADESRVLFEDPHGRKLVIFVRELFQTATPDLDARAAAYFTTSTGVAAAGLDVGRIASGPDLTVMAARPKTPKADGEAVLVLSTLVTPPDGSLLAADYYVNPAALTDTTGCRDLALALARSLHAGTRSLDRAGGTRTLSGRVDIAVPAGYVVTTQQGDDFEVHRLHKLVPLGEAPGELAVYLGEYADTSVPEGDGTPVTRQGTLAGRPATWRGWRSATAGVLVATVALDSSGSQLQVSEDATLHAAFLDELDRIAATIHVH